MSIYVLFSCTIIALCDGEQVVVGDDSRCLIGSSWEVGYGFSRCGCQRRVVNAILSSFLHASNALRSVLLLYNNTTCGYVSYQNPEGSSAKLKPSILLRINSSLVLSAGDVRGLGFLALFSEYLLAADL